MDQTVSQTPFQKAYNRASDLLITYQLPAKDVLEALVKEEGLSEEEAKKIITHITAKGIVDADEKFRTANRDILWGTIWFVGGLILTIAKTGFIFWGAIIFGGIQLGRGIMNRMD